jgi:UDP-GlcNAc:undecaprenyl-phosphate GlcNAc-1-phosphate transferase
MYIFFLEVVIFIFTIFLVLKFKIFFTKKFKLIDIPNDRKLHKYPTPILGGIISFFFLIEFFIIHYLINGQFYNLMYLYLPITIFFIGIYDDLYDLEANSKLFLITLVFFVLLVIFPEFKLLKLNFTTFDVSIETGYLALIFTVLCLLLFLNASYMIDGINWLFLGVNIIFFLYLLLSYNFNNTFVLSLLIILSLLFYCNYRNLFFMGDSGVFLISSILGISLIETYHSEVTSLKSVEEIFILLMIPGLDMFRLFLERIINKKNPFKPDRNHFHHLLGKKFNDQYTLAIYLFLVALGPFIYQLKIINESILIIILITLFYYLTYYLKKLPNYITKI